MDMSQYLDVFLEESSENLQTLNQNILELEKDPENKDIINSIFRVAHTLKGMAGSMGFTDIAELTHKMENVLDKFRNDILKVDSNIINVLFKCLDTLEIMIDNIRDGNDEKISIDNLIKELENVGESKKEQKDEKSNIDFTLNIYDENIIKQAKEKNYNVYTAEIILTDDCLLKSARSFLVYKTIEDLGEIIKTVPSVDDLEQENFQDRFYIMFLTQKNADEVKDLILNISEIKEVNINSIAESSKSINNLETKKQSDNQLESNNIDVDINKKQENTKAKITKEEEKNKKAHQSVRVDLERLDKFMNLVGELVIHRTRLEQISTNYRLGELHETLEQVGRITSDLQDLVMKVRMLPIERVFNRFPRMIRDLSQELGKDIDLIIKGEDTELDRTVIDEIGEPLVHLIRNAADHGIEKTEERIKLGKPAKGTIKLIAYQEGNKAVIKIEDDGKGLDLEKIKRKAESIGISTEGMSENDIKNLIFMQGFSTSEKVTDISGRGVGMDVVKTKISNLGGTVEVVSEKGKGTAFIIRLPLTLSIIQALLVKVSDETFAISLGFIDRVININVNEIKLTNNKEVILYRDKIIPIIRLSEKLNLKSVESNNKYIVIVKTGEKTVGLLVDELLGQQEIVIKPVGKLLQNLKEYVGATILGDGLVTLILDVAAIV
ncbi:MULTISPECIES: chemotaxis protein CheA [Caloramator]|uniref:Chemotaxis protein CheA n=1 Tax=Caloramator proteoclasticus DSM 10124 TaxID=1121262 RepID=A0A1M4SW69_9CLOT|nr:MULTISPECIES: chemotaxis protein CheA [Caloramator]SHE36446.1 two-component system, chemotaxis family, sensor kinase CheA [Caloramator proteoclasticus DSM 10124]